MRSNRLMLAGLGTILAMAGPSLVSDEPGRPGDRRNQPSGNTPVPGGGAKERAKRLARMEKAAAKAAAKAAGQEVAPCSGSSSSSS